MKRTVRFPILLAGIMACCWAAGYGQAEQKPVIEPAHAGGALIVENDPTTTATAAAQAGGTLSPLPAPAADPQRERELQVMAGVLQEGLDHGGAEFSNPGFPGASPFDRLVRVQYLPGVGAIFTIAVGYPLVVPAGPAGKERKPGLGPQGEDLWLKHQEASKHPQAGIPGHWYNFGGGMVPGPMVPGQMDGPLPGMMDRPSPEEKMKQMQEQFQKEQEAIQANFKERQLSLEDKLKQFTESAPQVPEKQQAVEKMKQELMRGEQQYLEQMERRKQQFLQQMEKMKIQMGQMKGQMQMMRAMQSGGQAGYDPKKVEALRRVLLTTLARYGWHLDRLGAGERVLLVVEAQIPDAPMPGMGGMDPNAQPPSAPVARHYVIAVPKTALTEATTLQALQGVVEEHVY